MKPEVLLAQLRALYERAPDFYSYNPTSRAHLTWLGQAHALISRWNEFEAISLKVASDSLALDLVRPSKIATILGILNRAIADLELNVSHKGQVAFAAGEVYDFFRELNRVIETADKSIFIIDPYLDASVVNQYLASRKPNVTVRLLLNKYNESLKTAIEKYVQQHGDVIEARSISKIHDRVVFIDGYICWITGQSLKDAAKAKPTYLAPLSPDVISDKLMVYEKIWLEAEPI